MSNISEYAIPQNTSTLSVGNGLLMTTKNTATLRAAAVMMYRAPNIQHIGGVSAFIDSRLAEILTRQVYSDWRVTRFRAFVDDQNGRIGWNIKQGCQELRLGISGSRLARVFRICLGVTVREYAKRKRLWIAAQRLKDPILSVKEIGFGLGYHSAWDFQRQFKQLFYVTPSEFRKMYGTEVRGDQRHEFSEIGAV